MFTLHHPGPGALIPQLPSVGGIQLPPESSLVVAFTQKGLPHPSSHLFTRQGQPLGSGQ